jgi:uncharacterized protein YmfQ (DUF2313 family)
MLWALLPPGRLWLRDPDSELDRFLLASADELARIDARGQDLIRESDPQQASELLPEFEAMLDLAPDGTEAERRARVVARLIARQRFRPVDFQVALAPLLGQAAEDVVVIERTAAQAATMGDLSGDEIFHAFIYRDPTDPGSYDLAGAQTLADDIKPSHTEVTVIESVDVLADDPFSLTDRDILGA